MVLVDLANAIPIAGVCLANAKALTPLASILKVRAEAQLGTLNPLPLVAVTGNNAGWVAYSAFGTHDMYIFASAAPGLLLGAFYVASILRHASISERRNVIQWLAAFAVVLSMADIVSFADCFAGCTPADAFGAVSSALQIAFYASPLPAMANAVRVGSSERIHAPFATAWLLNSSLWVTYGLWVHDWHIIVPQVLGVLVAAAQLGLVVTLGSAQPSKEGAER